MAENIIDNKQGSTAIPAGLPEGSVAIPHPDVIKDFDVTGTSDDNTTLFGIPKITSDNLTPEDPIDLTAGFRENIDTTASDVAGAKPIVSELDKRIAELTATPTETQTKFDETLSQFTDLLGETEGRSQAQLEAEQAQNIPQLTQDLSTVRGQILTKSAEFDALEQSLESKSMSTASLIGQQAVIRRAKASELNLLYAKSQALQGQVSSAQATVDRAINLKYETINTRLNIFERQLDAIQPQLNKEETIRAEAQRQLLEEEKQKVTDDKARDKQIQNIALEAIRAGLGNEISEQISNSKSLEEANQIAANAGVFDKKSSGGGGTTVVGDIEKVYKNQIKEGLLSQLGGDGFLNPDDYNLAKQDWIQAGGSPTDFDKEFAERRNPDNNFYNVTGKTHPQDEEAIRDLVTDNQSKEDIVNAGFDETNVDKVIEEEKEKDEDEGGGFINWLQFWK